jgi:RNA polymerase sigma-70 factor (ECF subfamily)
MKKIDSTQDSLSYFLKSGDEKAFQKVFEFYFPRLTRFAFTFLYNAAHSDDIVMEVMETFWMKRASLGSIANPKTYFYTCVRNKCIDFIRKKKDILAFDIDDEQIPQYFTNRNPEKIFLENELYAKIDQAVNALPVKTRMVYRLIKEDGLKYSEAADVLDISQKTVDYHLSNAMQMIRSEIVKYLDDRGKNGILKIAKVMLLLFWA